MTCFELIKSDFENLRKLSERSPFSILTSRMFISTTLIRLNTSEKFVAKFIGKITLQWFFNIEVASQAKIGPGLLLPHPCNIIFGCAEIGKNCTVMQGVTLGASKVDFGFDATSRPKISEECFLGVNSVILGGGSMEPRTVVKPNSFIHLKSKVA